jgi:hypothetical protein
MVGSFWSQLICFKLSKFCGMYFCFFAQLQDFELGLDVSQLVGDKHATALSTYLLVFNDFQYLCNLQMQCTTWRP